jgi:hypothetical protein
MQYVLLGDGKIRERRQMVGVEIEQIYRVSTGSEHLSDVSPYRILMEPPECCRQQMLAESIWQV